MEETWMNGVAALMFVGLYGWPEQQHQTQNIEPSTGSHFGLFTAFGGRGRFQRDPHQ